MNGMFFLAALLGLIAALAGLAFVLLKSRNMTQWFWPYVAGSLKAAPPVKGPRHVLFCFVDHYEPMWRRPTREVEAQRVERWHRDYPKMAEGHSDADGRYPQHTFFYPEEEYRPEYLDQLSDLCARGYGELEVHLHHDNDTEAGLREKLNRFCSTLADHHGALPVDPRTGKHSYAFIHGNWCLDNSRPDGKQCGVNNEIEILADTGCYADFTLPSAPDISQTSKINAIYYATETGRPKSHDQGPDVEVGRPQRGDLMIIQGPLSLNWSDRKWGLVPRIENSDIRDTQPPSADRVDRWVKTNVHVKGRPEWVFVKIHTHGTQETSVDTLLGAETEAMYSHLESAYNDGENYILHYVNAREMYNIAKAAEAGKDGNPNLWRDFILPRPDFKPLADSVDPATIKAAS